MIRFEQFRFFFMIHLANFRSLKLAQKSGKIQGIFQLLMSGNPVNTVFIFSFFFFILGPGNNHITSSKHT